MNRDVCEHFNPVGSCFECSREIASIKKSMMARMRKERKDCGLLRCEFWLTPEQKERVLKYVARFKRDV